MRLSFCSCSDTLGIHHVGAPTPRFFKVNFDDSMSSIRGAVGFAIRGPDLRLITVGGSFNGLDGCHVHEVGLGADHIIIEGDLTNVVRYI